MYELYVFLVVVGLLFIAWDLGLLVFRGVGYWQVAVECFMLCHVERVEFPGDLFGDSHPGPNFA